MFVGEGGGLINALDLQAREPATSSGRVFAAEE